MPRARDAPLLSCFLAIQPLNILVAGGRLEQLPTPRGPEIEMLAPEALRGDRGMERGGKGVQHAHAIGRDAEAAAYDGGRGESSAKLESWTVEAVVLRGSWAS